MQNLSNKNEFHLHNFYDNSFVGSFALKQRLGAIVNAIDESFLIIKKDNWRHR